MTRNTLQHNRILHTTAAVTLLAAALAFLGAPASVARQDPGPSAPSTWKPWCPVERVGTQIVRCDNLSGADVSAPLWLPVRR
jgi:hypothetical protein